MKTGSNPAQPDHFPWGLPLRRTAAPEGHTGLESDGTVGRVLEAYSFAGT